ncbi:MAG: helix-turn-helix transcriptional regulator [Clostridia bacterium]|nr:helix-turn-helix transcriptional regulator [Clostridia bacterium]
MTPTELGNRIADLRRRKGITQQELACRLNVTTQAVSKWETGAGFPDIQLISSLAKELDATVDTLFGSHSKYKSWYALISAVRGR